MVSACRAEPPHPQFLGTIFPPQLLHEQPRLLLLLLDPSCPLLSVSLCVHLFPGVGSSTKAVAAMKRLLRHLARDVERGVTYRSSGEREVCAYSDADWGDCADTARSTTGFVVMLAGAAIDWRSKWVDPVPTEHIRNVRYYLGAYSNWGYCTIYRVLLQSYCSRLHRSNSSVNQASRVN